MRHVKCNRRHTVLPATQLHSGRDAVREWENEKNQDCHAPCFSNCIFQIMNGSPAWAKCTMRKKKKGWNQ